jgi:hypothetical protein
MPVLVIYLLLCRILYFALHLVSTLIRDAS